MFIIAVHVTLDFLLKHHGYSLFINLGFLWISYTQIIFPQQFLSDIISVLAMTYTETNDCLKYRLLGSSDLFTSWGHEYVR